jgi:hypothetical protein
MTETTPGQSVPTEAQLFPGWWPWVAVALAFPVAGYIGWGASGHVDAAGAALIGGAITGAGLGLGEWLVAREAFEPAPAWIAASAAGYAAGLLIGAALVDYGTDLDGGGANRARHPFGGDARAIRPGGAPPT